MKTSAPLSNFLLSQVAPGSPSLLTRAPPAENLAKGPKANFRVSNQRSLPLPPPRPWPTSGHSHFWKLSSPDSWGTPSPPPAFSLWFLLRSLFFPYSVHYMLELAWAQLCLCPLLVPSTCYSLIPPSPDLLPCPHGA